MPSTETMPDEEGGKTPAPLFVSRLQRGETCYAENIRHIRVARIVEDDEGNEKKMWIAPKNLPHKLNKFTCTDMDICDMFADEPGTYWVDAVRLNAEGKDKPAGSIMPGGHRVPVDGDEDGDGDEDDGVDPRNPNAFAGRVPLVAPRDTASETMARTMAGMFEKQMDAASRDRIGVKDVIETARALQPKESESSSAQVAAVMRQMEELRRGHREEIAATAAAHRAELERAEKRLDDAKRDARDDRAKLEREHENRVRELREEFKTRETRWEDERRRLEHNHEEERRRARDDLRTIDAEFVAYRRNHETFVTETMAANFKTTREIAELQGAVANARIEHDRMKRDLERATKDADRERKEREGVEDEVEDLEEKLHTAERENEKLKDAKNEERIPIDGIVGFLVNKYGASLVGMLQAFAAAQQEQGQQQLGDGQRQQPQQQRQPATQTQTQSAQQRQAAPQTAPTGVRQAGVVDKSTQPAPTPAPKTDPAPSKADGAKGAPVIDLEDDDDVIVEPPKKKVEPEIVVKADSKN